MGNIRTSYVVSLFRLREINEDASTQQQPRKRSNSLPIPKIEVSMYQSPELKKRESKDFMEVPDVKDVSYLTGNSSSSEDCVLYNFSASSEWAFSTTRINCYVKEILLTLVYIIFPKTVELTV